MYFLKKPVVLAGLFVIGVVFVLWFVRDSDKTMEASCMPLYSSIAQNPGSSVGVEDYERFAHLKVPPLHPEEALERFELEEGFRIELVAHEPMVTHPVAMDIDADGRLWVVDMPSYMPVVDEGDWETAYREQVPQASIVVLEDTTGDGRMNTKRVFREELILPRAIKVLVDGVLVIEPPNVWFFQDTNGDGKGDTRTIVDDTFSDPNIQNVEGMPNGLMWGIDNWLHNSHNHVSSLRRVDGEWQKRPFQRLGQWGMTQDDWGRLYSAHNMRPLQTNFVPHGYGERHPMFNVNVGKNINIGPSEPMWPAHAVGSNRSYRIGEEVREDGTLRRATSTLGPVIYRGDQFGDEYRGNAFTPEPAANMIKRLILDSDPSEIEMSARFAYEGREFLTSTDERFRPVNMYNSPDGALYVVDMYHGVIQHARHLTEHLRNHAIEHGLHKGIGMYGRIYRIVRDDRPIDYDTPRFSRMKPDELVDFLHHENGHLRDQAQQLLVQCSPPDVISTLEQMAHDQAVQDYTRLHALWTLEGYSRSVYRQNRMTDMALTSLEDPHPRIRAPAVRILEPKISNGAPGVLEALQTLYENEQSPYVRLQLLASLGESGHESALHLMAAILNDHMENPYFRAMAFTGIYQREGRFSEILRDEHGWQEDYGGEMEMVLAQLAEAEAGPQELDLSHLTDTQRQLFERGRTMYQTCTPCHGEQGEGMSGIATPLAGGEWAQYDSEIAIRITLQGFTGGSAEATRLPAVSGVMPGHSFLSDEDVAAVLTFIRQSWGNDASPVEPDEVARIREETDDRSELWTPNELRALLE